MEYAHTIYVLTPTGLMKFSIHHSVPYIDRALRYLITTVSFSHNDKSFFLIT